MRIHHGIPAHDRTGPRTRRPVDNDLRQLPEASSSFLAGEIGRRHRRILALHARRLDPSSRAVFDRLGTALAKELPMRAFRRAAVNLRRHLDDAGR